MSDAALFAIAPYVAALMLVIGTLTRLSLGREPAPDLRPRSLFSGHRVSSIALLVLLASHAAMWTVPGLLLAWNQSVTRLVAFEIALFAFGLAAGVGLVAVINRSLRDQARRVPGHIVDIAFLGVLLVAIVSGLVMAARYRWASSWSAVTLTPYVRSLFALHPEVRLVAMAYPIKLHVFSGIALVALLPFTSVMDLLLSPVHRLFDLFVSPVTSVLNRQARRFGEWVSVSGRNLMWPEEED
jgi:nitrate reductase gamma subunit